MIVMRFPAVTGRLLVAWFVFPAPATAQTTNGPDLRRFDRTEVHMGMPFRLLFYAGDDAAANRAADAVFARIAELDRVMSDYREDSELMRLCASAGSGRWFAASDDLFMVLLRSQEFSQQSDGAFDVTVGPLVRLWRRARRQRELPTTKRLADAMQRVGYANVRLDGAQRRVQLLKPGMRLDLGGIAVGYAADEALKVLRAHDITRALIDGSGDIVVGDPPPGCEGWNIALAAPGAGDPRPSPDPAPVAEPLATLTLANAAVSTSGDAYQYVEIAGVRYSHLIDPRTGQALTNRMTVTVVAADGITADALASAVSVLGPETGMTLVESTPDASVLTFQVTGQTVQVRTSVNWRVSRSGKRETNAR